MEDLKIKFKNDEEGEEIKNHLISLGFKWKPIDFKIDGFIGTFEGSIFVYSMNHYSDYDGLEVNISQLRDMVILKRNNVNDATHTSDREDCDDMYYVDSSHKIHYWFCGSHWAESGYCYRGNLKPISKEKEYLNENTGEYIKTSGVVTGDSWVEIPDGADIYVYFSENIKSFYKNDFRECFYDGAWIETVYSECNLAIWKSLHVLWQRNTKPDVIKKESVLDTGRHVFESYESGIKHDDGKRRYSLIPKGSINKILDVLEFGARKYKDNNWKEVSNSRERYYNATMRHIDSWWNGEKNDQETGIHHLAHAATNLLFLIWFDEVDNEK